MTQIIFHTRGSGPPLLLLHAFPLNAAMWDDQLPSFSELAKVWAPDLPGFGASAAAEIAGSLDELAREIADRLKREGVTRAAVAGCSMGGYLAFALLRVAPALVSQLVLLNSEASADAETARTNRLALADRVEREGCGFLEDEWHLGALSAATLEQRPAVVKRVRALVHDATPAGVAAAQRAMASRPDSTPLLGELRIPVLVVHGLDDRYVSEQEARAMAGAIQGAQFVGVAQAGHLPNLERPEIVTDAVRHFLQSGVGSAST